MARELVNYSTEISNLNEKLETLSDVEDKYKVVFKLCNKYITVNVANS